LQENADVIAVLQAGFIGAWGEWYYTDHFATGSPNDVTDEDLQERSDMVYSLLDALPVSRQIQLRYVGYKMDFFGTDPITPDEAYSGNAKSRIAHHNDCFLSSSNDVGTYKTAYDRTYLKADSKYISVGGETCRWFEPRSNCDTALVEMARYHWSFINIDYFGTTIQNWKDSGCFDDIQRKMGYRYELVSSSLQDSSKQKGSFYAAVQLANQGFSNPYNPRSVELVLRNCNTKKEFFLPVKTDIRKKHPGEVFIIEFEGGIPAEAENGTYDVFLNLPDPMISLRSNPKYSIRLANENTWESATGYNRLSHTLIIHPSASAPDYEGTDFFANSDQHNRPLYENIYMDGNNNDWEDLPTAYLAPDNQKTSSLKVYNDIAFFYSLVHGSSLFPNSRFFIDADNDPATGMNVQNWQTNGMDYLAENSSLYKYSGENGSSTWSWQYINPITAVSNDSVMEMALPLNSFSNLSDTIRYGYVNGDSDYNTSEYIPYDMEPPLVYALDGFIDHPPSMFSSHYANNAILYWGIRENDDKFRIIERSTGDENNFNVIAILSPSVVTITDPSLEPGITNNYRSYLTDFQTVTPYTPSVATTAGSEIFRYTEITPDGQPGDWFAVKPLLSLSANSDYFCRSFADTKKLNFLITGKQMSEESPISGFELYLETDNDTATGTESPNWVTPGLDFKITNDSLFGYQQGWKYNRDLGDYFFSDSLIEFSVPFTHISLGSQTKIQIGLILFTGTDTLYLPFRDQSTGVYNRISPTGPPTGFHLVSSQTDPTSKIIIRWDKNTNCDGHVIEKLTDTPGTFKTLVELDNKAYQYIDDSLDNHTNYSYRMYSYNGAGKSDYTYTASGATHDVGIFSPESDDRFQVFTDPSSRMLIIRLNDPGIYLNSVNLYDISGRKVYSLKHFKGEPELTISLQDLTAGIYLLSIKSNDRTYSETILVY
jgi:hypothetical protein